MKKYSYALWYDYNEQIKSAEIHVTGATDVSRLFYGCKNMTSVDLSGLDTSNITNMNRMFCDCSSLTDLDVSGFNTSNVTKMSGIFVDCKSLKELDLSSFDMSKAKETSNYMISGCNGLEKFKTPRNCSVEVYLPDDDLYTHWEKEDGTWIQYNLSMIGNSCPVLMENLHRILP